MISSFAEILGKTLRRDMNDMADQMANGQCRNFDEYQKLVGVIRGLALAEEHLKALAKKANQDDETP